MNCSRYAFKYTHFNRYLLSAIVALCVYGGTGTRVFSSVALRDVTDGGLVYNVTGAMWAYIHPVATRSFP